MPPTHRMPTNMCKETVIYIGYETMRMMIIKSFENISSAQTPIIYPQRDVGDFLFLFFFINQNLCVFIISISENIHNIE